MIRSSDGESKHNNFVKLLQWMTKSTILFNIYSILLTLLTSGTPVPWTTLAVILLTTLPPAIINPFEQRVSFNIAPVVLGETFTTLWLSSISFLLDPLSRSEWRCREYSRPPNYDPRIWLRLCIAAYLLNLQLPVHMIGPCFYYGFWVPLRFCGVENPMDSFWFKCSFVRGLLPNDGQRKSIHVDEIFLLFRFQVKIWLHAAPIK